MILDKPSALYLTEDVLHGGISTLITTPGSERGFISQPVTDRFIKAK